MMLKTMGNYNVTMPLNRLIPTVKHPAYRISAVVFVSQNLFAFLSQAR